MDRSESRPEAASAGRRSGLYVPAAAPVCTDNAAMIAAAGTVRLRAGERAPLDLNAGPNWSWPHGALRGRCGPHAGPAPRGLPDRHRVTNRGSAHLALEPGRGGARRYGPPGGQGRRLKEVFPAASTSLTRHLSDTLATARADRSRTA